MKRKTLLSICVIAVLAALFVTLSLVVDNGAVGKFVDPDGFIMSQEDVAQYVLEGGDPAELSTVDSPYYATYLALLPPVIAIVLALITKEVYSSLFVGILSGALLATNFNPVGTLTTIVSDGFISSVADSWNAGILMFLVLLGMMVALINKAGGSYAFGNWAKTHVKTRMGAQFATLLLGCLIFVDDYFNCLTVGSIMKPVSDSKNVSRAKLAYLIDATAAPICMIAPISSWAAAVAGVVVSVNGLALFIKAIPYNFYSLLTLVMIITITVLGFDYGPMKRHELNAKNGDLFSEGERNEGDGTVVDSNAKGGVIDLVLPIVVLIVSCILGMIYTGGFFDGESFIDAFSNCDASAGLALGSAVAVVLSVIYLICRKVISFKDAMNALPKGFCAMVPAILILCFAWTLNGITGSLGADIYVYDLMFGAAEGLKMLLPAVIFLVAVGLSFATGTSWGTFGILIPIVTAIFPPVDGVMSELLVIGISACLAGAVCGDHCSPISDTTIMASAGAQCNHVNHVATQLPYAVTVAAVSFVCFIIAGFIQNWLIVLPIGIVLMVGTILGIKFITEAKSK
ncbi:MAG: Na+/H+ antiporter NhaC family protein [Clostridia bacterium]|nr:Na+/H+ antiporter NhaC family protein [Clostridia bacterium]